MPTVSRTQKNFTGSKGGAGVIQRIINLIPPCRVLIEPFAGQATLARSIRAPDEIILIDRARAPALEMALKALPVARFVQGDGIAFISTYKFRGNEFVYADPPYVLASRSARGRAYYEHEMSDADHRRFLRVACGISCRVLISGYRTPLYDEFLGDWFRIEFPTMTRGGPDKECLWHNYPAPQTLHDYRFVGENFRARCRLRRKIRRAVADLVSMPPLERGALFSELAAAMQLPLPAARAGTGAPRRRPAPEPALLEAGTL